MVDSSSADEAATTAERPSDRTGPVGRVGRLVVAIIAANAVLDIVDQGGLIAFRRLPILEEPGVWLMTVVAIGVFFTLVEALSRAVGADATRFRVAAAVAITAVVVVAIAAGLAISGSVWAFPLSDLTWGFDVLILGQTVVASLMAIRLGTPGCEVGAWTELIARARYGRVVHVSGPACVVGLHLIDAWEAGRRRAA